ncbi:FH1/FH2 domain-containing protein 3 isoform X2 [Phymastichus coffea]|uniref:FH1/FH2 domain-containing protein 3 isoform X2 n=1 Tax=Phymastichus coffea TaxID=108790 RepID=UPI00273B845A|nr:FH1/FH2 domain-containing protein 3 isoform X2 [Phymastichus coffea]
MIRKKMSSPINKYVNKDFRKSALNMENGDASRSQILSQKKYRQKSTKNPSISCQDSQANSSSSTTTPSNRQFPAGSSSQSFSSDASGSNSSNENKEENQSNYANKSRISKNKNESSALITDAKQLVSSVDERSINVNSLARTRSTSKSTSDAFHNTDEKSVPLMHNPSATAILSNSKSCCTASFVEGNSRVSLPQSSSNGPQCTNLDDSSPANKNSGQARHQFSDEVPWWLDPNSDNVPEGVERHFSVASDDTIQDTTISSVLPDDGKFKFQIWHQGSEERCWWVDDNDNDCTLNNNLLSLKNETASPVRGSSPQSLDIQSGNSGQSKPSSPEVYMTKNRALRHEKSGERAWWLSDDPNNIPEGVDVIPVSPNVSQSSQYKEKRSDEQESQQTQNRFNRLRHIDSGERPWWLDSSSNVPEGVERISLSDSHSDDSSESLHQVDCTGIQRNQQCQSTDEVDRGCRCSATFPLSNETFTDRTSLEGREISANIFSGGRSSPYDNIKGNFSSNDQSSELFEYQKPNNTSLYIGNQTNIDDLLEGLVEFDQACRDMEKQNEHFAEYISDRNETICEVGLHGNRTDTYKNLYIHRNAEIQLAQNYMPLDDSALQLYKDGDYGAYLDLEASISEQQEEFEGFQSNRKNSIVLRTQLSVRVHTIIEKLLNSEGRELRRALFSLKQIFQEDKDLVHEFVQNDGLACLIKVGSEADQNYQNYILRALGQVMLYVDGMNGVMEHGQTVQWLYSLIASRFRLVVKTALKLLLVFVEYVESNSLLLVRAIRSIDTSRGMIPWTNVMKLLKDYDAADTELLIYTMSLVNKCLNGIPDQDTYYDQVDCLEEQGIQIIIQNYMGKQGTDLDLLRQFHIYEAVLHHEDSNERDLFSVNSPIRTLDDNIRKTLRNRKSLVESQERRKSRRHSTGTSPHGTTQLLRHGMSNNRRQLEHRNLLNKSEHHARGLETGEEEEEEDDDDEDEDDDDDAESSSSQSSQSLNAPLNNMNGSYSDKSSMDVGVTPALRRRRERAERQRSFIREQQEASANMRASFGQPASDQNQSNRVRYTNGSSSYELVTNGTGSANLYEPNRSTRVSSRRDTKIPSNTGNKFDSEMKNQQSLQQQTWYAKSPEESAQSTQDSHADEDEDRRVVLQLKRENTVKDLTQKLAAQHLISTNVNPAEEKVSRIGDMSGLISKAKEGLAKSKSKAELVKSPTSETAPKLLSNLPEVKKSENELHWEELIKKMQRPLCLCDLDFTDLNSDDEIDVLGPVNISNGAPPPPPPMAPSSASGPVLNRVPPPPPPGVYRFPPPLPSPPPPLFGVNLKSAAMSTLRSPAVDPPKVPTAPVYQQSSPQLNRKSKKTVKLFWKEVRDDPIILSRLDKHKMIWDELSPVPIDTQKLEHLFESRAKDLITKKQQEMNKNKEIIVLDHKRSNAINIGMTKLPPPRSIKTAILKMDATIMNREGIEKLLTMLPTEEERSRIQEAQAANPDLPLGSAEQFLLTLASISELPARLKLWAFKLDFENSEKEVADPLMDLKQGMETLRVNKTFRGILSTLLSIGIFLNGNEVKGFQMEYLAKVPEVKDTVHKHSLLHHLCHMVMEKFPGSTDLYSEIGAVTRASKVDFDELAMNINKLESECKASWDHLKLIAKHDGSTMMKVKMSDFLTDCAERIIVLSIVHRRIINRFHKFILWLGIPLHRVQDTKPNEFCRIVSEFSLEYRTTRERVLQQLEKKANHRERNKTRGKMITEVGKFRTKEDRADAELRQLLGSDISDVESIHGTLPWRRQRKDGRMSLGPLLKDERVNGNLTDGDDELLESLVKTATKTPATRTTPRERKRTRHADLKRSRTRENNTTPDGYRP